MLFQLISKLTFLLFTLVTMSYATKNHTVSPFNLSSPPDTDIWRKPPSHNVFNAPTHPSPVPQYDLKVFQRAQLTFALPPGNELRQYDQAGLLLHFTKPGLAEGKDKWIKSGIEWYYGNPYISTVGCDAWADWSIVPLSGYAGNSSKPTVTIEAKREKDQLGKSLWVYQVVRDGEGKEIQRLPLRELTWVFAEEEGWSVGIAGYVCRPTKEGGDAELHAEFAEGVQIETLDS